MERTEEGDDNEDTFDLGDFVSEQSELFVTMGVFSALAIYISRSTIGGTSDAELMIKTGFVCSFGLAILMFGLIYLKLIDDFGGLHPLYRAHFQLRNIPLALFSLFTGVLLLSLSYILTQREPVIFLLLLTGAVVIGLGLVTRLMYGISRRVPRTAVWRISTMFFTSLITLLITLYFRTRAFTQFEVTTIQNLSLSDPIPVMITVAMVLVATVQSLAALGVLMSIFAIPLIILDKIRGQSPYDEAT